MSFGWQALGSLRASVGKPPSIAFRVRSPCHWVEWTALDFCDVVLRSCEEKLRSFQLDLSEFLRESDGRARCSGCSSLMHVEAQMHRLRTSERVEPCSLLHRPHSGFDCETGCAQRWPLHTYSGWSPVGTRRDRRVRRRTAGCRVRAVSEVRLWLCIRAASFQMKQAPWHNA
jgi:hypothetical protein